MDRRLKWLYRLADTELGSAITPGEGGYRFTFHDDGPVTRNLEGVYDLDWRRAEETGAHFFHSSHPLAVSIIRGAATREMVPTCLHFKYQPDAGRISAVEGLRGKAGWMRLSRVTVTALEAQDFIVLSGVTEDGTALDEEVLQQNTGSAGA